MGGDLLAGAVGRLSGSARGDVDPASPSGEGAPSGGGAGASGSPNWRVRMLHGVTETLRGAADEYLAAKLDEIEARVDEKLDEIEARLDRKVREIHTQLGELRDQEIRHRLRILRLTLIFTVLVAALSLVYKWVVTHWVT